MSLREYASLAIWDFVLCVCMSLALVVTACQGFNVAASLQFDFVRIGCLCALLGLVLQAAAFNKRCAVVGGLVYAALALGLVAFGVASTARTELMQDLESNLMIFYLIVVLVCSATFGLSRFRVGSYALLVLGCVSCALMQFLYASDLLWEFLLFLCAAVVCILYKNYVRSLRSSQSHRAAFVPVLLTCVLMCALAIGGGAAIFFGVVAPLDPPARQLILITDYKAKPEVEIQVTDNMLEILQNELSQDEPDVEYASDVPEDGEDEDSPDDGDKDEASDESGSGLVGFMNNLVATVQALMYEHPLATALLVLLALLLLFALPYGVKRTLRARRFARMCALEPAVSARVFYAFFVERLGRIGIEKVPQDTPREFLTHAASQLQQFEEGCEVAFGQLTQVYEKAAFAGGVPSAEELRVFERYYAAFYKNAQRHLGRVGYLKRFFLL